MALADEVKAYEVRRPRTGQRYLGASAVYGCRRQSQYRITGTEPSDPEAGNPMPTWLGTAIHKGIERTRKALYPERQYELRLPLPWASVAECESCGALGVQLAEAWCENKSHHPYSTCDEYDPVGKRVQDYKSTGTRGFDRREQAEEPDTAHKGQVDLYAYLLTIQGYEVQWCSILYIDRENGRTVEYEWPFDLDEGREAATWLIGVQTSILEHGVEQPRDRKGPGLDPICTDWCQFKSVCWNLPTLPPGFTPQSATVKHDAEVEEWAAVYDEARAQANKWGARKKEAAAYLSGFRGTYGRWFVGRNRDTPPQPVLDAEAAVALLTEHGLDVPTVLDNGRAGALQVKKAKAAPSESPL